MADLQARPSAQGADLTERPLKVFQFIEGGARYGAAVSVMNIAEGLRQHGIDLEFGIFAGRPLGDVIWERGFVLREVPANHRYDFRGIRHLIHLFREQHYDVVHTHLSRATINGSIAARITRTPVVATVHGMNRKYTYMLANHIMTVSEAAKRHLVKQGIRESRVTPVYNSINTEPFDHRPSPAEAKAAFGFEQEDTVIGTISRAHYDKGIDLALRAVEEIRWRGMNAKYLFVGDGPHLVQFRNLAVELGIAAHVRFPGFSQRIVEALAAMDVFMFPTQREAFGISLLEAMAAEVPVVASMVDGVNEVLDDDSGILLSDRTPSAFATAAQTLLTDSCLREDVVRNARNRVDSCFSLERTARDVEKVYRLVVRQAALHPRARCPDVL
ncbi:MAG: glycosyltransferase family 4 protein [Fimbriimonadales bacterium]